jgi:RNA polymerase sigma-70 factor, ECF subfamily
VEDGAKRQSGSAQLVQFAEAEGWFLEQAQREHARLRAFIRAQGVRSEAVDDLAQEAFLVSFRKLDEFDRSGDFGAWVRQIARRLIANGRRKESRRHQLLSDHATDFLLVIDEAESACRLGRLEHQEDLSVLRDRLSKMPRQGRDLLQQRYFEDLSPGVIAGRLGQSSNQIRQTLLRLRRALLACMTRRQGFIGP